MKRWFRSWSPGTIIPAALIASAIFGFAAVMGTLMLGDEPETDMYLSSSTANHVIEETFTLDLMVGSEDPVNVFAGEIIFDPNLLQISSIDYNTGIADLWAEKPWYENGEGTLNFAGGTTRPGGFFGTGSLITITFEATRQGNATIYIRNPRILRHDGLGTDTLVRPSIDTIIIVDDQNLMKRSESNMAVPVVITKAKPRTDLNGDGKQSIADVSIFMLYLARGDMRGDFNEDGNVSTADLSLLLATH